MAQIDTHPGQLRAQAWQRPAGFLARLRARYQEWKQVQATMQELRNLTDRELDDLGIRREMIAEVARGHLPS